MEENNHHQEQNSNRELDRFSSFMFGNRKPKGTSKESEELSLPTRSNFHDDWIFGRRRKEPELDHKTTQNKLENFIDNVDIGLLLETYDTLVTTTQQYKPIIKGIVPFFSKISGKFKKPQ